MISLNHLGNNRSRDRRRFERACRRTIASAVATWSAFALLLSFVLHRGEHHHDNHDASQESGWSASSGACGLYLAESSIPNGGFGVYAGRDYRAGDAIGYPDICIQLIDMKEKTTELDQYRWDARNLRAAFEAEEVRSICPGFGMALNAHMGLHNVELVFPGRNDGGLQRTRHPGSGAVTAYHNVSAVATTEVRAGSELFLDYGVEYFATREHVYGQLPTEKDYIAADATVKNIVEFVEKNNRGLTSKAGDRILNMVQKTFSDIDDLSGASDLIPTTITAAKEVASIGAARHELPESIRSSEWLQEENGRCLDSIGSGPSNNVEAGAGAFAKRFIPKGGVITSSPLIHFVDKEVFQYEQNIAGKDESKTQLLVNYCFGHRQSSLLLYPYSPIVNLINHDSKSPNAEVRWSSMKMNRADWLKQSLQSMEKEPKAGLVFDYVATRDIQPGDEVLISYGRDWELAWEAHTKSWVPWSAAALTSSYVPPSLFNNLSVPVRTEKEQKQDPYPSNLQIACYYEYIEGDDNVVTQGRRDKRERDCIERRVVQVLWEDSETRLDDEFLRPCKILSRSDEEDSAEDESISTVYTAHIYDEEVNEVEIHEVTGMPRAAIIFLDRVYESDQHLKSAFRHPIGIPDSIFPERWKNSAVK